MISFPPVVKSDSALPCAAEAALWLFLGGRRSAWRQTAGSPSASTIAGTPPALHGNLQPAERRFGEGKVWIIHSCAPQSDSTGCVLGVPAAGRPPAASAAPGFLAADSPSCGGAGPADPAGGWPRRPERTPAARRRRCSQSPPWHDGTARRYVKPGITQRVKH